MRSFSALTVGIGADASAGAAVGTGTRHSRRAEEGLIFVLMLFLRAVAACNHATDQRVNAT